MASSEDLRYRDTRGTAFWLSLKAGALYFAMMFGLGWVTGPLRELLIIPLFGQITGGAVEATIMIGAMVPTVRWINWLLGVPSRTSTRAIMGLAAFCLLLPAEMLGALIFRGQSPVEFLFPADPLSAAAQWGLLLLYAVMPLLVRGRWTFGDEIAS